MAVLTVGIGEEYNTIQAAVDSGTTVDISNNTIVNDEPGVLLYNGSTAAVPNVTNNQFFGLDQPGELNDGPGSVNFSGNTNVSTRPTLDMTSPLIPESPDGIAVSQSLR